jgi:hypothetical protein
MESPNPSQNSDADSKFWVEQGRLQAALCVRSTLRKAAMNKNWDENFDKSSTCKDLRQQLVKYYRVHSNQTILDVLDKTRAKIADGMQAQIDARALRTRAQAEYEAQCVRCVTQQCVMIQARKDRRAMLHPA